VSILLDENTRTIVQGITGRQGRFDSENCQRYGTKIVAGVTPGRGGDLILGIPVYNTVRAAVEREAATASVIYVPAGGVKDAILEAIEAGIRLIVVTSEGLSNHSAAYVVAAARDADVTLVGPNTVGIISPGKSKLGGIGGVDPADIYTPGRIGICSRSGGMTAELALSLTQFGYGISTAVAMGGDSICGRRMVDYVTMFENDPETDAVVVYGEPGTKNESELAEHLRRSGLRKPIVAMIAGYFQERYPKGMSFGHAAAMIRSEADSASAKRALLSGCGVIVARSLLEVPKILAQCGVTPNSGAASSG
jgi:succinyl-CoA synthetase alpha subunit